MQYTIIFVTASSKKEAEKISDIVLGKRIAACTNIIGNIDSHFWWKGKKEKAKEYLLMVKTRRCLVNKLIKLVKSAHSYNVPEIIAIPLIAGYKHYFDWIEKETKWQ